MSDGTPGVPPAEAVFSDPRMLRAHVAAMNGDVAELRALTQTSPKLDLDTTTPSGVNLLMYEILAGNGIAMGALLQAGADPNALAPEGASPMLVAGTEEDPRWLTLLLDAGGDPNLKGSTGEPLIVLLVPYDRWGSIVLLLDRGANIDAVGPSGQTATLRLGALHQFERVNAMLDRGADPSIADAHGLQLKAFVTQRVAKGSPELPWRDRVAERLGLESAGPA